MQEEKVNKIYLEKQKVMEAKVGIIYHAADDDDQDDNR